MCPCANSKMLGGASGDEGWWEALAPASNSVQLPRHVAAFADCIFGAAVFRIDLRHVGEQQENYGASLPNPRLGNSPNSRLSRAEVIHLGNCHRNRLGHPG